MEEVKKKVRELAAQDEHTARFAAQPFPWANAPMVRDMVAFACQELLWGSFESLDEYYEECAKIERALIKQ